MSIHSMNSPIGALQQHFGGNKLLYSLWRENPHIDLSDRNVHMETGFTINILELNVLKKNETCFSMRGINNLTTKNKVNN